MGIHRACGEGPVPTAWTLCKDDTSCGVRAHGSVLSATWQVSHPYLSLGLTESVAAGSYGTTSTPSSAEPWRRRGVPVGVPAVGNQDRQSLPGVPLSTDKTGRKA